MGQGNKFGQPRIRTATGSEHPFTTLVVPDGSLLLRAAKEAHLELETDLILIYAAEYADFATAHAAASGKTLVVSASMAITTNTTIGATTRLKFENTGKISVASGVVLTIPHGNIDALLTSQIFVASNTNTGAAGTGKVEFTGELPREMSWLWWGGAGDGVTDNLPAADALIAAITTSVSGANPLYYRKGTDIVIPAPAVDYRFSNTWNIYRPVKIRGAGGGMNTSSALSTILQFTIPCTGIKFHRYNTFPGVDGTQSDSASLESLAVYGTYAGDTGTADMSGLTVTRLTGPDYNVDFNSHHVITVHGYNYVVKTLVGANSLTVEKPRPLAQCTNGSPTVTDGLGTINGTAWPAGDWDGQVIKIDGVSYTISSHTSNTITLTTNFTGATGTYQAQIQSVKSLTGVATTLNKFHGVDSYSNVQMKDVTARGFSGNGFNIDTSTIPSAAPGATDINANNSALYRLSAGANKGHGILTRGLNSNNITITNFDGTSNNGAGAMEVSFLGNVWVGLHTSFNTFASFFSNADLCAYTLLGMYSEGGQPTSVGSQYGVAVGGDWGANWAEPWEGYYAATRVNSGYANYMQLTPGQIIRVKGDNDGTNPLVSTATMLGEVTAFSTFFGIGAGDDTPSSTGTWSPTIPGHAYRMSYGTGWYVWAYDDPNLGDTTKQLIAFSGSAASAGAKKLKLPNGVHFIGNNEDLGFIRSAANTLKITDGSSGRGKLDALSLELNGGTPVTGFISATATLDFDLTAVVSQDLTIALTGAALGDSVMLGVPHASVSADITFFAWVSAADVVSVRAMRGAGTPDPASGTFKATIIKS